MSDAKKSIIATQLFTTGSDAVKKGNFDYAIDCFLKCATLVPEKLIYRQALRGAEQKYYKDNKKGAAMAKARMMGSLSRLQLAKTRKKWPDAMEAAEDALRVNPWDSSVLYDLAYAANELQFHDTAIWVAETATAVDKESADLYRLLAGLYEHTKQFKKAITAWETVKKLDPKDEDAQTKAHQIAAQETIDKGKYEQHDSFKKQMEENQNQGDASGDSVESRLKREIATLEAKWHIDNKNVNLMVQIGELYRKLGDYAKAGELFQKAIDSAGPGGNIELRTKVFECQIEPLRKNLGIVTERMNTLDKTAPDAAEKAKKLKQQFTGFTTEIVKREIDMYRFKISLNAEDHGAHFELGYRLLRLEQYDDAIKSLQLARGDQRRKWEALCWLGVAFWKKRNFALAEKNLADAQEVVPRLDEEAKKRVLYFRACIAQEKNETQKAVDLFNEIAAIDYGYKDVSKRLDALNNPQSQPASGQF